jgi:hypothetical protein
MDDQLVLVWATDTFHRGATAACRRRHDPEAMEVAPEANGGAVPEAAPRSDDRAFPGHPLQMPAEPRLALREKRADVSLRIGPAATPGRRDGHDDASVRVDDDAQTAGAR